MADSTKADLIRQLDRARSQAAASSRALADDLQVGDKLKESIGRHRGAWISGAVLTGLVVSKLPPRTKKIVVKRNGEKVEQGVEKAGVAALLISAAKMVFDLVRPFAMRWLTARLTQRGYLPAQSHRTRV